ncbi:RDD family protein [Actinophytocola algeriensis]|uniref:Putative RDD family membrane protein YckC n=1 Tax=Actinophytocola algeriensis TaxID=1768010 RepID=A0A7W7Q5E5_9PSEU|nr:RDD family protein [Actinophytocola algeriensis]MBB4907400.1 putative RDD family membrane protein YckC [Actinophytocola algeriensis]MBE1479430.1 putative RDD family membrane protein YckC [Actinophytocola algeriensis]
MSRVTGSWLSGGIGETGDEPQEWPGERLGLPKEGPGSVAPRGVRLLALLIDLVLMSLATSVFVEVDVNRPEVMQQFNYTSGVVWFVITSVMITLFGFTAGKALLGLRVVRLDGKPMVGPVRAVPRTLLTALLLPAAIADADSRGLHDKVTGTVVVRTR